MNHYLYFDTIRLNPDTGGVLNVSSILLRQLREMLATDVESVSERFPRIYRAFDRIGINRFILDTLIYNYAMLRPRKNRKKLVAIFPNYFLPFTLFGHHTNATVIVHDLQFKAYPENFGFKRVSWLNWSLKRVAGSQARVVFISKSSQKDFNRYYGGCLNGSVILNPVETGIAVTIGKTTATPRYLIAAYHYYPHKNFRGVLDLFAKLRANGIVDFLYVTGNGAGKVETVISQTHPDLRDYVVMRGLVTRDELARLYLGARAFVSMSHFEGFNLSAAEAATLGVPLLLSDIPAHRELFGGYAFLATNGTCNPAEFEAYLETHASTHPAWRNTAVCSPHNVAEHYLTLHADAEFGS